MFDIPPETPWLWYWLGAAGLLGLLIGILIGRLGTAGARKERSDLESALDEALGARSTAEEATAEAGALAAGLQQDLDDARSSLADAEREIDRTRSDLDAAETRIVQLEAEALAVPADSEEIDRLRSDLAAAEQRGESLRAALSAAAVDADTRAAAARAEAEEAAATRIDALEAELADTHRSLEEARQAAAEVPESPPDPETDETIARLRERLAEAEDQLEQAAAAPAEADAARDHVIRELQAKVQGLSDVEDRLRAREAELGELRRTQAAVVAAKDGEIRSLRERLEARERTEAEPAKPDPAVVAELAATRSELAATQERAEHWEREASSLRRRLAEAARPEPAAESGEPQAEPAPSGPAEPDDPRFAQAEPAAAPAPAPAQVEDPLGDLREALADKEARIAYLADRVARLEAQFGATRQGAPEPPGGPAPAAPPAPAPTPESDDLTAIWGVGPAIERKLNSLGITTYDQVARLERREIEALGEHLGHFLDRIEADDWVGQARRLVEATGGTVSDRPLDLDIPAVPDDLKQVRGIGPSIERTLNALGVTTLRQIADWTPADVEAIGEELVVFPGRIERERWVEQAREILARR